MYQCSVTRWQTAPTDALLQRIAASTEGFAGADLQALCTAAVMAAVTRSAPHLVDQLCLTAETKEKSTPFSDHTGSLQIEPEAARCCHTAPAGLCPDPVLPPEQQGRGQASGSLSPYHAEQGALAAGKMPKSLAPKRLDAGSGLEQPSIQQEQVYGMRGLLGQTAVGGLGPDSGTGSVREQQQQQQPHSQQEAMQDKNTDEEQDDVQRRQQQQQPHSQQQEPMQAKNTKEEQDNVQQQQQQRQGTEQQQAQQPQGGKLHPQGQDREADPGNSADIMDTGDGRTQEKRHRHVIESSGKLPQKLLDKLRVKAVDWRTALAAAPLPCSSRQSLSALSSGHAKALPHHLVPLLLPYISRALHSIAAAQLPWEAETAAALGAISAAAARLVGTAVTAAAAVAAASKEAETEAAAAVMHAHEAERAAASRRLEGVLAELGVLQAASRAEAGAQPPQPQGAPQAPLPDLTHQQPHPRPCKLLLCGEEDAGQAQVAGALLKLLQGVQVHTVSLPVLVLGGSGDTSAGLVQLLGEALRRASSHQPLVLYLPSLEAWALDTVTISNEDLQQGEAAAAGLGGGGPTPTRNAQPSITPLKAYPASISPFRGLVSLQARQGGSGGSRGNPTSGPTSARKATPAPARHLSFPHPSPDSHAQPSSSARAGWISPDAVPDVVASPASSLPNPRAAPHSPRPLLAADQTPTLQLRADPSSPGVTHAALASPTLSLPTPKASWAAPGSPALEPQGGNSGRLSANSVGPVHGPDDAAAVADGLFSSEETKLDDATEAEVHLLSEVWKVFEQVVKQVTPSPRPLCNPRPPPQALNFKP
ncbi:hypothetical protein ABBQ38_000561 [Trebouxia sp. C0009 RCD-2024]